MRKNYPLKNEYIDEAVKNVNEMYDFINEVIPPILEIMKNSDDISVKTAVDKLSDVLKLMDGVKQNDK